MNHPKSVRRKYYNNYQQQSSVKIPLLAHSGIALFKMDLAGELFQTKGIRLDWDRLKPVQYLWAAGFTCSPPRETRWEPGSSQAKWVMSARWSSQVSDPASSAPDWAASKARILFHSSVASTWQPWPCVPTSHTDRNSLSEVQCANWGSRYDFRLVQPQYTDYLKVYTHNTIKVIWFCYRHL